MATLDQEQIRAVDQARQRLLTLHTTLNALRSDIATTQQPLPSWSSLQTHANLISNNIQTIATQLSEHQSLLRNTAVFPLPQFPGKYHANVIETLLRTKLEPGVEDWIDQGQKIVKETSLAVGLSHEDRNELWQWAPRAANAEARKQAWGADFTLAEKRAGVESVVTGLERELLEPPDPAEEDEEGEDEYEYEEEIEEDGDGGDKMDVDARASSNARESFLGKPPAAPTKPQLSLESIHRFITTGRMT